jgi:hypothetical protein
VPARIEALSLIGLHPLLPARSMRVCTDTPARRGAYVKGVLQAVRWTQQACGS